MIVSIAGKGGVGKTSLCSILLDELARSGCTGPVLAVDADPATTLHLALGLPGPRATVANVRDTTPLDARTVRGLENAVPDHVREKLYQAEVITRHVLRDSMALDLLAMGQGEGPGCYCSINRVLAMVLAEVVARYALVVIDNEAGVEHVSRYRLPQADLLLVVVTSGQAAQTVARRILATTRQVGMVVEQTWLVFNRVPAGSFRPSGHSFGAEATLAVPASSMLACLDEQGRPAIKLPPADPIRLALQPIVEAIRCV